ncbi:MAG: hypothetical protein LBM39_01940 [Candidatus Methanoplasma sp.]|jgi:hypothetical protein|nr:hypothetical protein [Candidatus Methanoplasma sp.]
MRYETLTPQEKFEYKDRLLRDFTEHGMTDEEALVNYVHCVNRDPVKWMSYKYNMPAEKVAELRESGLRRYHANGGKCPYGDVEPPGPKEKKCNVQRIIVPQ